MTNFMKSPLWPDFELSVSSSSRVVHKCVGMRVPNRNVNVAPPKLVSNGKYSDTSYTAQVFITF